MKFTVTVTLNIDTDDYAEPLRTKNDRVAFIQAMVKGETDLPETVYVEIGEDGEQHALSTI